MHAWLCKSLLKTLSVNVQSTIAHAIKKLSEDWVADKSKDDSSGTEQEVVSTFNESMNVVVLDYLQFNTMSHMRCAAHTLQLAIHDRLKIDTVASLVNKIHQIVAAARASKLNAILKRNMNKGAIVDQATM